MSPAVGLGVGEEVGEGVGGVVWLGWASATGLRRCRRTSKVMTNRPAAPIRRRAQKVMSWRSAWPSTTWRTTAFPAPRPAAGLGVPFQVKRGEVRMGVIIIREMVGTSPRSWSDAARQAVATASRTVRNIREIEVVKSTATGGRRRDRRVPGRGEDPLRVRGGIATAGRSGANWRAIHTANKRPIRAAANDDDVPAADLPEPARELGDASTSAVGSEPWTDRRVHIAKSPPIAASDPHPMAAIVPSKVEPPPLRATTLTRHRLLGGLAIDGRRRVAPGGR